MSIGPIHLEMKDQHARRLWCESATWCAYVAGAFVVLVGVSMLVVTIREAFDTPLKPAQIDQLKRELDADPQNQAIKEKIRDIDERLRNVYFGRRAFFIYGAWMMLGGLLVLALSAKFARDLGMQPYVPQGPAPLPARWSRPMKIGIAGVGAAFAAMFLGMRIPAFHGVSFAAVVEQSKGATTQTTSGTQGSTGSSTTKTTATAPVADGQPSASEEEMKKNWPNFRGASALGYGAGEYPTEWNGATGKNILWKAPIPQGGKSSPVVWNDRVFVTGGGDDKREAYCFDVATGKQLWTVAVGKNGPQGLDINKDTTWAPSTPSTDGRRVFAIFPTGDLVAINFDGTIAWSKNLGPLKTLYGHAASLLVWSGILYVQLDQGEENENLSALYAFDCATGKQVWSVKPRPVKNSWTTPMVVPATGGPQLIIVGDPLVCAYEPKTGAEIWRSKGMGGEVAPSGAFTDNTVVVAVHGADYMTIRCDGKGDVSATHRKKLEAEPLPDIVSPLCIGDKTLLCETTGFIALVEAKTGKAIWDHETEKAEINASPIAIGNRVYLTDKKGVTHVIEIGNEYKEIGTSPVGQEVCASPAFVNGKIFIRGAKELFCIGQGGGK